MTKILSLLTAIFYVLFTLIPESHSKILIFPWVFLGQIGLLFSIVWLLIIIWQKQKFPYLGNGFDWVILIILIGLSLSTLFAEFNNQALWNASWAIGFLAAIYALNDLLNSDNRRYKLLLFQGYLNIAFIIISLLLWISQTYLPELNRLATFQEYGVNLSFDFSVLELRNWAPLGHQNYVAGYLLLAIPLLAGLSILSKGKQRILMVIGLVLGLIDLYTTSSRGGWLGLFVILIFTLLILLFRSTIPRLWIGLGGIGSLIIFTILVIANNRLRTLVIALSKLQSVGEIRYRITNFTIGWLMGIDKPFSGIGLGGVPLLYQKYRPIEAGRTSEITFQLHGTPPQLWAEMGIWGILSWIGAIFILGLTIWLLFKQKNTDQTNSLLIWSICAGGIGYLTISLIDYQLDNFCISGTLVIYLAIIASSLRQKEHQNFQYAKQLTLIISGIILAISIWLIPIHRGLQISSFGFIALFEEKIEIFVKALTDAHKLAPWDPYYPYQLGWNLHQIARENNNPELLEESINWFTLGVENTPYWEYGHSNLGWLLINSNPQKATEEFAKSAQLIPAKKGVFYGLGLSLLLQNKVDLAVEAMTLETIRDPLFITSPIWQLPLLKPIFPLITNRMLEKYNEFLAKSPQNSYWHNCRGGLYWWLGDFNSSREDLIPYGSGITKLILQLGEGKEIKNQLTKIPNSPAKSAIEAWLNPSERKKILNQAWIQATKTIMPENIEQQLIEGMAKSNNFEQWLKENPPILQYYRQRTGFGFITRHLDGITPTDFWLIVENAAMVNWFNQLLPSPQYNLTLESTLQPQREELLAKIKT